MIRLFVSALFAALPVAASAEVRAVFVGVNDYLYDEKTVEGAGFVDLRASVADVVRIKAALRRGYGLDLDEAKASECKSVNALSITLTDRCATRRAILDALDDRIAASSPGDTLLFYFAGHGGQYVDDQVFDQASGMNATILPTDARQPDAASHGDILDRELRFVFDRATAKGINVVTIFDSCHSESAGRGDEIVEGWLRGGTPVIKVPRAPAPQPIVPAAGISAGYRVHFAAAGEEEDAREIARPDFTGGIFTAAFADTLTAMPHASFHDIAEEVRLKVQERGTWQNAHAEGALNATLGGAHRRATLLSAAPGPQGVTIAGGRLSGVTLGSSFALFARTTDALDEKAAPLATGRVAGLDVSTATLALDAPPKQPLPQRLVARETAHAFGTGELLVRLDDYRPDAARRAADAIAGLPFARVGEPAQLLFDMGESARLSTVDGVAVATLGDPADPHFPARFGDALRKVARVNALLGLRTDPATADAKLCFAAGDYDVFACAAPEPLAAPRARKGQPARLTVVNRSDEPRYLYVLSIDPRYAITRIVPSFGGRDPPVAPRQPLQRPITPSDFGTYRFVTIASDAPIDLAPFEQEGIAFEESGPCSASPEPARCAAASGAREPSIPRVAKWSVTASAAYVEPAKE